MPIEFLTDEQEQAYGDYLGPPSTQQLSRYFHLDDADRERVNERRCGDNKLGFAVQMTIVRICAPGCCTNALVPTTASCSATSVTRRNASGTSVPPSSMDGAPTSWSIRLKAVYGGASANFSTTLSAPQSDLALQTLRDPYVFDFLSLGAEARERDLEPAGP